MYNKIPEITLDVQLGEIRSFIYKRMMLEQEGVLKLIDQRLAIALSSENLAKQVDASIKKVFDVALSSACEEAIEKLAEPFSDMFSKVVLDFEKQVREKMGMEE